jgi:hypothetical protein
MAENVLEQVGASFASRNALQSDVPSAVRDTVALLPEACNCFLSSLHTTSESTCAIHAVRIVILTQHANTDATTRVTET